MELYPLRFEPKLSPKIWGGRRLERYGKQLPAGIAVGESWDIYDRPEASAVVAEGALKGSTLQELMVQHGAQLLGEAEFKKGYSYFPLMVKLIDAREALSVQVHPDDAQALRMVGPKELGKTEMWVVLEAQPGATVVAGLKQGASKEAFLAALKAGQLESVLQEIPVKAGDRIFIPAGRVHAIGKGCLMAELQQNSDTTWRVYDYGRFDNGKPRDLHVSQAMECIRFDAAMAQLPALAPPGPLVCDYFNVEILGQGPKRELKVATPCFQILMGLKGQSTLFSAAGPHPLGAGETLLIPASLEPSLEIGIAAQVLWARP